MTPPPWLVVLGRHQRSPGGWLRLACLRSGKARQRGPQHALGGV